jgi:hypothetical protein
MGTNAFSLRLRWTPSSTYPQNETGSVSEPNGLKGEKKKKFHKITAISINTMILVKKHYQ